MMLLNVFLFCIYPNAQNWSVLWSKSGPFFCKRFCLCLCSLPKSTQQKRPFLLLAPIPPSLPLGHCYYCFVPQSLLFVPIYRSAWTDCEFPVVCSFSDEWSTIVSCVITSCLSLFHPEALLRFLLTESFQLPLSITCVGSSSGVF